MTFKIVNVTAHIVARNIADTLADSPQYPYKMVFSIPYYQQLLIARVLSGIRNQYIVVKQDNSENIFDTLIYFLEEQEAIDALIQESLDKILGEDISWSEQVHIPDNVPVIYPVQGQER